MVICNGDRHGRTVARAGVFVKKVIKIQETRLLLVKKLDTRSETVGTHLVQSSVQYIWLSILIESCESTLSRCMDCSWAFQIVVAK
jgi:hypothetical protein